MSLAAIRVTGVLTVVTVVLMTVLPTVLVVVFTSSRGGAGLGLSVDLGLTAAGLAAGLGLTAAGLAAGLAAGACTPQISKMMHPNQPLTRNTA